MRNFFKAAFAAFLLCLIAVNADAGLKGVAGGSGGGGTPGGTNGQIQYNNSGVFGGKTLATTDLSDVIVDDANGNMLFTALLPPGFAVGTANSITAFGDTALFDITIGVNNTAVGSGALSNLTSGGNNSLFGGGGSALITGSRNTGIGLSVNFTGADAQDQIAIGYAAVAPTNATVQIGTSGTGKPTDIYFGDNTAKLHADGSLLTNLPAPTSVASGATGTTVSSSDNSTKLATTAQVQAAIAGKAVYQTSFQPGLVTSVSNTKSGFAKISKTSTVDNIEVSAQQFSCAGNPTITMYECGTSTTCASSPTTIGSATITAAGTVVDGTISSSAITAGDYIAWAISAGTCVTLDIAATAQIHSN